MDKAKLQELDNQYIAHVYSREDVAVATGKGAVCHSADGKRYIDFSSGIGVNSLGFCDPEWTRAVSRQAGVLQHTSNLYYTEPCALLAEKLVARTGLKKVFFGNSGAEANEGAIKAARKYSFDKYGAGRHEIITLLNSFHGRTMAALSATGQEDFHEFFHPFSEGFKYVAANETDALLNAAGDKTCALMIEMIQGEGGVVPLTRDFVRAAAKMCAERDILLIVDEVQTGAGRTGKFFAYEHFGVNPDLVTAAKGLGGGLPIGAVLFGEKCENAFGAGDHGSTFGGNPVVCAGGLVVMDRIDEAFLRGVREKSEYMTGRLKLMKNVVRISGMGLMLGIEIEGKTAHEALRYCVENGLLILSAKDKIRLLPPLVISREEIDEGLEILEQAIAG
ncbi:MAG: aspartate aminotransferase family protein [Clostridiales Family XIII bacterium]|jgi:acetylornithine/N-succinyldiaminopimelate aminotransferase|nr:aspartate aminotransferase family protein [Clostridiales Family XIII bacterium]